MKTKQSAACTCIPVKATHSFDNQFREWVRKMNDKIEARKIQDSCVKARPGVDYVVTATGVSYDYTIPNIHVAGTIRAERNMLHITQFDTASRSMGATVYRLDAPAVLGLRLRNTRSDEYMLSIVYKGNKEETFPVPVPAKVGVRFLQHYEELLLRRTSKK